MELAETWCLADLYKEVEGFYSATHQFKESDVRELHRRWLGTIYPWAGAYRSVAMRKGNFPFAAPRFIPQLMKDFSDKVLAKRTPCRGKKGNALSAALAHVHVELVVIHPFRDGNGRMARLLADLMARQAGWPWLNYRGIQGPGRERYFAAIRSGLGGNYQPMERIFSGILRESR